MKNIHFIACAVEVPGYGQKIVYVCQTCGTAVSNPDGHTIVVHQADSLSVDSTFGNWGRKP